MQNFKIILFLIYFNIINGFYIHDTFAKDYYPARVSVIDHQHISDLYWDNDLSRVLVKNIDAGNQYTVLLFGKYTRDGWKLNYHENEISLNAGGGFKVEISFGDEEKIFEFEAVGPNGEIEKEKIIINFEDFKINKPSVDTPPNIALVPPKIKRWYFVPGFGVGTFKVKETRLPDYSSVAGTFKLSANYLIVPQKWDFGFSGYLTALQFSKSSDITAKFLGLNARLGYLIPNIRSSWILSIYTGWYYTTTFVSGDAFGYKNIGGPQIYPTLRRALENGDFVSAYFKFSPVDSSLSVLNFSNREIATGLSYVHTLKNSHSLGATLDISNIYFSLRGGSIQINTFTLGVQYRL